MDSSHTLFSQRILLKILIGTFCSIALFTPLKSQVGSSGCLDEVKYYLEGLDPTHLCQADSAFRIDYTLYYCHRNKPEDTVRSRRYAVAYKGQIRLIAPDQETYVDDKDAFIYYPHRYVMYRLSPSRVDNRVLEKLDLKVLKSGKITNCGFTKATDTTSNKLAVFKVDAPAQAKTKIRELHLLWSPLDSTVLKLTVFPTPKHEWTYFRFEFDGYDPDFEEKDPSNTAKGHVMLGEGELKERFQRDGAKLMDYR